MPTITASIQIRNPVPAYLPTAAYAVKRLTTTTSGRGRMYDALTAEWQARGDYLSSVDAWSGAARVPTEGKLIMFGGGHGDSAMNGLMEYDFNGTTAPFGFTAKQLSAVSAIAPINYTDGRVAATHSYDGIQYDPTANRFMVCTGTAYWPDGFGSQAAVCDYGASGNGWARVGLGGVTIAQNPTWSAIDLTTGYVLQMPCYNNSSIYDLRNNTWVVQGTQTGLGAIAANATNNPSTIYDSRRQIVWCAGGFIGASTLRKFKWNRPTDASPNTVQNLGTVSVTGDTGILSRQAPGIVYDQGASASGDRLWMWSPVFTPTTIYQIANLDGTPTMTAHTLSGDSFLAGRANLASTGEMYGRMTMLKNWRAIGLYYKGDDYAYAIKLPDAA